MSITYSGIEWDYNNLNGISYSSETLLEPYGTWFYLITNAVNYEKESFDLGISDSMGYNLSHHQKESIIKVKDYSHRLIRMINSENLSLSDEYNRGIISTGTESITLTDESKRKVLRKNKEDTSYLLDECRYVQYDESTGTSTTIETVELSGAISLFDFELKNGTWSQSDFNTWCDDNCPVNYNELRPFIPGEYEYKDAYVGFRLSMPPMSGRYGVANSTVYIDVEDTVEKGNAEITAAEIANNVTTKKVYFSKRFYTSPHIMTSLLYTTENSYVYIKEITTEYFEFGFKSVATQQFVAGEINWLADGY